MLLNKDFGYIFGVLKGDGNISKRYGRTEGIRLKVKDVDFVNHFREVAERCFNKKGTIKPIKHNERTYWEFRIYGAMQASVFEEFTMGSLLSYGKEVIKGFLEGFIDSEGYISKRCNEAYIYNSDLQLLRLVQIMLSKLGIESHLIEKVVTANSYSHRRRYAVAITNKFNLIKLRGNIRLHVERKKQRLNKVEYGAKHGNTPSRSKWNFFLEKHLQKPHYVGKAGRMRIAV